MGLCKCDEVKDLDGEIILDYLAKLNIITWVLKEIEGGRWVRVREENVTTEGELQQMCLGAKEGRSFLEVEGKVRIL